MDILTPTCEEQGHVYEFVSCKNQVSVTYTYNEEWYWQFIHIVRDGTIQTPLLQPQGEGESDTYLKVISGSVEGVSPCPPLQTSSALYTLSTIRAGGRGAVCCVFRRMRDAADITTVPGCVDVVDIPEGVSVLDWTHCNDKYPGAFAGHAFYNLAGVALRLDGALVSYFQMWAAGLGVDCGMHDHSDLNSDSTFCEQHFTLYNGSGAGGMAYLSPSACTLVSVPLPVGYEHGPFWHTSQDGRPLLKTSGCVSYPLHKWQAGGEEGGDQQQFDLWAVFETRPQYV
ncbi:hypothetical protein KIPB_001633 [Kipferlia bialata]|uniref:Aldos-2-ulose dehydratase/isomerase (AUDH) Cupin domain-containing protein n=1 Tax=Kipferlia bialata TaxID=797122 RepID=A0A391NS51_9EUKA|nr:hypothetical protein KIPB_001633 [Kipferlia bialata]|eukprot:g1633.t1